MMKNNKWIIGLAGALALVLLAFVLGATGVIKLGETKQSTEDHVAGIYASSDMNYSDYSPKISYLEDGTPEIEGGEYALIFKNRQGEYKSYATKGITNFVTSNDMTKGYPRLKLRASLDMTAALNHMDEYLYVVLLIQKSDGNIEFDTSGPAMLMGGDQGTNRKQSLKDGSDILYEMDLGFNVNSHAVPRSIRLDFMGKDYKTQNSLTIDADTKSLTIPGDTEFLIVSMQSEGNKSTRQIISKGEDSLEVYRVLSGKIVYKDIIKLEWEE